MYTRLVALLVLLLVAGTASAEHPLEPVDTSSPRATMKSFLALTEEGARRYTEYRDSPSPATENALLRFMQTARRLLDLSQVPPAARREVGGETFVLLWEVIARLELPELAAIPDAPAGREGDETAEQPTRWRIPGTEITIAQVEERPRAGEFLFSPNTVERARLFYEAARELPYLRPMPSENLVRTAQSLTGWMIPIAWVEALPAWAHIPVLGQVLWKWFAVVLLLGLTFGTVIAVFRWGRRAPWNGSLRSYLRHLSAPLAIFVLGLPVRFLGRFQINVTGSAAEAFDYLIEVANGVAAVWLIWVTASWIAAAVIASPRISSESLDAHLIRLAARSVGILAILVLMFRIANDVGIPVYGLVAGAGVGGLALALAAKSTLENFVGALNLFTDRPVRVGDLCRYDEDPTAGWRPVGRVESIGLRSTRIRQLDGALITIPNADFALRHIVNLSAFDRMLLATTLGLRYETTGDQLRFLLAEVRELLHAHPKTIHTTADPVRVRFVGFGDFALNVAIRVYIQTPNRNEFLAIQEDILLRIMNLVKQAGTGFAFPSRTLYVTRDGGLDDELRETAEGQVREWAAAQTLPFPDFAEDYRKQITDTLDYPPDGSPGADSG
jgi:MscS family membrane protein